jgi:hypothetical protein
MEKENLKNGLSGFAKGFLAEQRPKIIALMCMAVAFGTGYGLGSHESNAVKISRRQLDYTTNDAKRQPTVTPTSKPLTGKAESGSNATDCKVKGNIGSGNKKTYHVAGGAFYDRTNAEVCFATEAEASAAGFIKASK